MMLVGGYKLGGCGRSSFEEVEDYADWSQIVMREGEEEEDSSIIDKCNVIL